MSVPEMELTACGRAEPHRFEIVEDDGVDFPLTPKEMNWHLGLFAD